MENDSIETLLHRHYGNIAPAPATLEQRLLTSLHTKVTQERAKQEAPTSLREKRVSRRHAVRLVAKGTTELGLGILSIGLEGLQSIEATLSRQDAPQTAYS